MSHCRLTFLAVLPFLSSLAFGTENSVSPTIEPHIALTQEERAWLKVHPQINVAVSHGWGPIEILSERNELRGISVDYLKRLELLLGVRFNTVHSAENPSIEKADMLSAVANPRSLQESRFVALDEPYLRIPVVIFTRKDNRNVYSFKDLNSKKVAVFKTGTVAQAIAQDMPQIQLYKADIAEEALQALDSGKVEAYVGNLVVISYVARNQGFGNIKIVGETPYKASVYMAVRSDWPLLQSILQKGLLSITQEDRNTIYNNWANVTYERKINYQLILTVGAVMLGFIALFAFWSWRLGKEVKRRISIEESLRDAKEAAEAAEAKIRLNATELARLGLVVQRTTTPVVITDASGLIEWVNPAFTKMTDYEPDEVTQKKFGELLQGADTDAATVNYMRTCMLDQVGFEVDVINYRKSGSSYWVHLKVDPLLDAQGKLECFISIQTDITERKSNEESMQLAALVYQNSSEAMLVTDAGGVILTINPAFTSLTGYLADEIIGKTHDILSSKQSHELYEAMWHDVTASGKWQGELINRRKNGEVYTVWLTINSIYNEDGSPRRRVALFSDITQKKNFELAEKKQSQDIIWQQANLDFLTGLPNRRLFHERLDQEMEKSHHAGLPLALMFLDLDHFKEVNDSIGHGMGDLLLVKAAKRLKSCLRSSDIVARVGGDEFNIIMGELHDVNSIERVAKEILRKLAEPFQLKGEMAYISTSIGITLYPNDATEIDALLRNADQAMYAAKSHGRNRFNYFTYSMQEETQTRMRVANDLRSALPDNQFVVYYQPIIELATGNIHKAEALIRWQHPTHGLISPADFIPIAEDTGLIVPIGDWVFREAANQVSKWRSSHHVDFQISINKSPVQFRNEESTHAAWFKHLQELGLPGHSIVVEITEGLILDANKAIRDKLLAFRDAGVQVAIDDFGIGYSSLSYLKKFDIDYLKIDQSFVRNLALGSDDMALCEAIIVMAHKLGIQVIAEGVETKQQRDLLLTAGCDYGQGYLFSKPVPAQEFENLL